MTDNNGPIRRFGLIVGAIVAAGALAFLLTGGDFGGKKTVEHDEDLPPVSIDQR